MKFRAYETFYLRKGWLHKGVKEITKNPELFWDKKINPMDELGIGNNMVKSLRYWLTATGIAEEIIDNKVKKIVLTDFGKVIWENDPYFEEDGTWFFIHYLLTSNLKAATSWYYVFNEYKIKQLTKEDFITSIKVFIEENDENIPNEKSLSDDFDCIIKTYWNGQENTDPESNFSCPLTSLGLVKQQLNQKHEKEYFKTTPSKNAIHPMILLSVILDNHKNESEIKISDLENANNNIGKIFNLDNMFISEYLDQLQNRGYLKVIRTAGLDVVNIKTTMTSLDALKQYYIDIK